MWRYACRHAIFASTTESAKYLLLLTETVGKCIPSCSRARGKYELFRAVTGNDLREWIQIYTFFITNIIDCVDFRKSNNISHVCSISQLFRRCYYFILHSAIRYTYIVQQTNHDDSFILLNSTTGARGVVTGILPYVGPWPPRSIGNGTTRERRCCCFSEIDTPWNLQSWSKLSATTPSHATE